MLKVFVYRRIMMIFQVTPVRQIYEKNSKYYFLPEIKQMELLSNLMLQQRIKNAITMYEEILRMQIMI